MSDPLLELYDVSFAYKERQILRDISMTVHSGKIVALMGPSGCGKTTLLALLLGLQSPSQGAVTCSAANISVMFQDPRLLPWRTALDNVAFVLKAQGLNRLQRQQKAAKMLKAVGLEGACYGLYPRALSGGMRQRVALARALVVEPDLLLLDEPFHGLDFVLIKQMQDLIARHVDEAGMGLVIVTHDARQATAMADEIILLSGAPTQLAGRFEGVKDRSGPSCLVLAERIEQALLATVR